MEFGRRTRNAVSHQLCFMSAACLMLTLITGDPLYAEPHDPSTLRTATGADGSKVPDNAGSPTSFCAIDLLQSHKIKCFIRRPSGTAGLSRSRNSIHIPVSKSAQQAIRTHAHNTSHQYRSQIQQRDFSAKCQH
jgi:hypothetical protein